MKIIQKKISDLNPYEKNSRLHSQDQIKLIASSIKEFGFTNPILIDKKNMVVAGHGRLAAAKFLKLEKAPCIVLENLTEAQKRAYVIADNKIALGSTWDEEKLASELEELQNDFDFDLNLIGFDDSELDNIFIEKESAEEDDFIVENHIYTDNTVSERGDVWILGDHRLMCGDSTSEKDFSKLILNKGEGITFTSPPYNIDARKETSIVKNYSSKYIGLTDQKTNKEYLDFLIKFSKISLSVSKYLFINIQFISASKNVLFEYLNFFRKQICEVIIWKKSNPRPMFHKNGNLMTNSYEFIFVLHESETNERKIDTGNFSYLHNFFDSPVNGSNEFSQIHKATFPIVLSDFIVKNMTRKRMNVIDPFNGTGATLISCENLNRKYFGMEIEPFYVDTTIKRWQALTEKDAVLESSNKTFNSIMDEKNGTRK